MATHLIIIPLLPLANHLRAAFTQLYSVLRYNYRIDFKV